MADPRPPPMPLTAAVAVAWPDTPWNLPPEISRRIFGLCRNSWERLMQVNRAFHDLAARFRYKSIELGAEDLLYGYLWCDDKFRLPRCLDTLANSPYNYARYMGTFALEEVEEDGVYGRNGVSACSSYTGSFINGILPAVLSKATRLKTFRWDIRIKIGKPVYKILHGIKSLSRVSIRMRSLLQTSTGSIDELSIVPPLDPPLLSGFKNIKHLDILNVDNLESVLEIQAGIHNSRGSLQHLHLSMSMYWVRVMNNEVNPDALGAQPNEAVLYQETALAWILGIARGDSGAAGAAGSADDGPSAGDGDTEANSSGYPSPSTGESSKANAAQNADKGDEQEQAGQEASSGTIDNTSGQPRLNPKLHVKTLGLQRIRVTKSVLSRGFDIHALTSITLLDIGCQVAVWKFFELQNETKPLALMSIHTNNVTLPFAQFVSKLATLHRIYLANSASSDNPNMEDGQHDAAPSCSLDSIRRHILKPHAATLRVISINEEEEGSNWFLDRQTLMLLAHKCEKLEELCIRMDVAVFYEFQVIMPLFRKLIGLNIPRIGDDIVGANASVDVKHAILAVLSLNPHMPLQFFWHDRIGPWFVNQVVRSDARQAWLLRMVAERQRYHDGTYNLHTGEYEYVDDSQGFSFDDFQYRGPRYTFDVHPIYFTRANMSIFSKEIVTMSL